MIRRAALAAGLLLILSTTSVSASEPQVVEMKNYFFDAATVKIPVGDSVEWHNGTGLTHTTTANQFNTWDRNIIAGNSDQVLFARAGTFAYHRDIHPEMKGKVKVRMSSFPTSGTIATPFMLRVATVSPPSGFVEDVQRRKGSNSFKTWMSTSNQTIQWTPNSAGMWQFRARLRKTSNDAHTGWSQPLTIVVN